MYWCASRAMMLATTERSYTDGARAANSAENSSGCVNTSNAKLHSANGLADTQLNIN